MRVTVREPGRQRWAICCSGGGIRSAAYCLGAMQELQARIMDQVRLVTAVSGGSYLAAGRAAIQRELTAAGVERPPFARGSDEERHLRQHTRYLVPGWPQGLVGVGGMLIGAALNLVLLLAWLVPLAILYGWFLSGGGLARQLSGAGAHPFADVVGWHRWWAWGPAAALGVIGVLAGIAASGPGVARSRRAEPLARLAGYAAAAGALLGLLFLAVPEAVVGLSHLARTGTDAGSGVLQGTGFAHPTGFGGWWKTAGGLLASAVALGRVAIGRITAVDSALAKQGWLAGARKAVAAGARRLVPWIGSAAIVVGLAAVALALATSGATRRHLWVLALLAVPLLARVAVDVDRTSLHDFYRWRLTSMYEPDVNGRITQEARGAGTPGSGDVLLSELAGQSPVLAICTTVNATAAGEAPAGRRSFPLVFDPEHVTLHADKSVQAPTTVYERLVGRRRFTLFDIVGLSGAAVSPLMGRMTHAPFRILFTTLNVRLGMWLPNPDVAARADDLLAGAPAGVKWSWGRYAAYVVNLPGWARRMLRLGDQESRSDRLWAAVLHLRQQAEAEDASWWARWRADGAWRLMQPTLGLLLKEAISPTHYRSTWLYVTDGGHFDNSGLLAALYDPAVTDVVVLDASGDTTDSWSTIGQAFALAASDLGVNVDLDPTVMKSGAAHDGALPGDVTQAWARGALARRGASATGAVWVVKAGVASDAPWAVRAYERSHRTFPCDSTGHQLFDEDQFEAYRALGAASVRSLPDLRGPLADLAPTPQDGQEKAGASR